MPKIDRAHAISLHARHVDGEIASWIVNVAGARVALLARNPTLSPEAIHVLVEWAIKGTEPEDLRAGNPRKGGVAATLLEPVEVLSRIQEKRLAGPDEEIVFARLRELIIQPELHSAFAACAFAALRHDRRVTSENLLELVANAWGEERTLCRILKHPSADERVWWRVYEEAGKEPGSLLLECFVALAKSRFARVPKAREALLSPPEGDYWVDVKGTELGDFVPLEKEVYFSSVLPCIAKRATPTEFRELVLRFMDVVPDTVAEIVATGTRRQCRAMSPADLEPLFTKTSSSRRAQLLASLARIAESDDGSVARADAPGRASRRAKG